MQREIEGVEGECGRETWREGESQERAKNGQGCGKRETWRERETARDGWDRGERETLRVKGERDIRGERDSEG